jgi:hypothetical protein
MMRHLLFCALILLSACGGGGGGGGGSGTSNEGLPQFPPFTERRSDFINGHEGLAEAPMNVAVPPCANLPAVGWQDWLCTGTQALPKVYAVTNAFSTAADPHFAWIISLNNEFVQVPGCNTGPPNQSLGSQEYPFSVVASAATLELKVLHDARDFCGKIPYASATYIRGVQGDPQTRLMGWQQLSGHTLELDFDVERPRDDLVWFRVLLHFRDPRSGQRYLVNNDYISPDPLPDYFFNWNWPYVSSFQFPGAKIAIPARVPAANLTNGLQHLSIDVRGMALRYFPDFGVLEPDFLGVEIAVELGQVVNQIGVTLHRVEFR